MRSTPDNAGVEEEGALGAAEGATMLATDKMVDVPVIPSTTPGPAITPWMRCTESVGVSGRWLSGKTVYEGTTIGSEGCGSIGTELEVPEGIVAFGDDNGGASGPVEDGSVATTTLGAEVAGDTAAVSCVAMALWQVSNLPEGYGDGYQYYIRDMTMVRPGWGRRCQYRPRMLSGLHKCLGVD